MGARIESTETGTAPLHIRPVTALRGIDYRMPMASAQVKSAVLLAGLAASGDLLNTGPTGTNVTDLVIAFRQP